MNPFDQFAPYAPPAPPVTGHAPPGSSNPELDAVKGAAGDVKPPKGPDTKPPKGIPGIGSAETLAPALTPVLAAAGAVAKPESFLGKKLMNMATGFHIAEGEKAVNKIGPGSVMILGPEPIGVLPEHFFQGKPKVPGTNIYLDPIYNAERYLRQREDRLRAEAGAAQVAALTPILPTLSTAEVRQLVNSTELRQQFIGFVPPKQLDALLFSELERRRAEEARDPARVAELQRYLSTVDTRTLLEAVASLHAGEVDNAAALLGYLTGQGVLPVPPAPDPNFPFSGPFLGGSILVERIPALIGYAIRNQLAARGINRELVTERIDP